MVFLKKGKDTISYIDKYLVYFFPPEYSSKKQELIVMRQLSLLELFFNVKNKILRRGEMPVQT